MSDPVSSTDDRSAPALSLDETLEAFETAWNRDGHAELEAFLPSPTHPEYEAIVAELLCVDLERRWTCGGQRRTVEEYRRQFPTLTALEPVLERLVFEEYRLACTRDATVSPDEYGSRYRIRTDHWPRLTARHGQADAVAREALADGVADEMARITAVTQALPSVGDHFLNFKIVEQLGRCKFGSVFLATQLDLANRLVVVKVTTNLWSESDWLARLQHTNIVPIYSVHQHAGLQAVCMPYLGRHTLETLVHVFSQRPDSSAAAIIDALFESGGATSKVNVTPKVPERHLGYLKSLTYEQLCTWIGARMAAGLSHAHERGILHRDLKPANILLTDDMQPMILDFNLSEEVVAGGRSSLLIGGTLPYMAPEHLRAVIADGDVDQRSDIYSLGVILFQVLTGQLPYPQMPGSILGSLSFLINDRCSSGPSPRNVNPRISRDMESIVKRCLAADPGGRYQTAHDLCEDLEAHLHHCPLRHAPNRSPQERMQKWFRRHPRIGSSAAVFFVCSMVLAATSGFLVVRGKQVARLKAVETYREFAARSQAAAAPLSAAITDLDIVRNGLAEAEAVLAMYSADRPDWPRQSSFRYLDREHQVGLMQSVQTLQYLRAEAVRTQASREVAAEGKRDLLALALRCNESARTVQVGNDRVSPALLFQQADLEAELGHKAKADDIRRSASKLPPGDSSSRLMIAVQHIRSREYSAAEPMLEQLRRDLPQDFFVWFLLGNCNFGIGRLTEADGCFTASAALRPEYYFSYFQRGICRLEAKRWAAAESDFSNVLRLRPDATSALANRALARLELNRLQDAATDLSLAIARDGNSSLMYLLRSRVWTALGERDKAAGDLEKGKSLAPTCSDGWIHRALAFLPTDPTAALRDLDAALDLTPVSRKALRNKAAILSQLNRNEEAVESLSILIDAYPNDAAALLGRGLLLARLAMRDAAIADGAQGVKLDDSPQQHYQLARILAQTSKQDPRDAGPAANHLLKALQGNSNLVRLARRDADLDPILHKPEVILLLSAASKLHAVRLSSVSLTD